MVFQAQMPACISYPSLVFSFKSISAAKPALHTRLSNLTQSQGQVEQKEKTYKILAWEPSSAKVTKSYSRRLPALERFYRETKVPTLVIYIDIFNTKTSINNIRKNCLNAKFII